MKIKLSKAMGGHEKGDTITVSDSAGRRLIDRDVATEVKLGRPKKEGGGAPLD